eukprot:730319-Rhodomonas_salina.5
MLVRGSKEARDKAWALVDVSRSVPRAGAEVTGHVGAQVTWVVRSRGWCGHEGAEITCGTGAAAEVWRGELPSEQRK